MHLNPALAIIDAHIHTELPGRPDPFSGIVATLERFLTDQRRAGVIGGLTDSARPSLQIRDFVAYNIHRCSVVSTEEVNLEGIEAELAGGACKAIKINLGFIPCYASDTRFLPVYEMAKRYQVPVLFHTGDPGWPTVKIKFAHPMTIDEVVVDHPAVNFVLVHAGNPWFETAAVVADKNPNVFLEISGLLNGNVAELPKARTRKHMIEPISRLVSYLGGASKLIFGSGWPMVDLPAYVAAVKQAVPKEHWQAVFHDNAARLLRVPSPQESSPSVPPSTRSARS